MKKILIGIFTICFCLNGLSQETKTNTLLKEVAENGCKCIDSIVTSNKTKEEITKQINACIDAQTGAYQVGSKLMGIDLSKEVSTKNKKKSVDININMDKDSKEYKSYYYEIERYLMNNCPTLKKTIAACDIAKDKSVSKNPEALEFYSKGQEEYKKENYKEAISYYQQALKIDSVFAFAWDNIGICNRKLNNYEQAIYAYKKSLELDPNGYMPLQNIAVAYKFNKEYDKAISAYKRLAELDKNDPEVFYGIGETYSLYLNDYEKGLENMCKAYNLYVEQKSPYRSDAESIINTIYGEMKKQNKVTRFNEILEQNHITANFK